MTLPQAKIKSIDFLINKIAEKDDQYGKPANSFLLGAGCSLNSNIPLGRGVIEICKKLSFLDNHPLGYSIDKSGSFFELLTKIDDFKNQNISAYEEFIIKKENEFRESISDVEIKKSLPQNIIESIGPDEIESRYKQFIYEDLLYSNWFEVYTEDPKKRQELIENIIDNSEPSGEYILLAYLIAQGTLQNIFTSNFDDLINEAILNYTNVKCKVYAQNEIAKYISINGKKPNIIKLHGDYLFENVKNVGSETASLESNMKIKFKEALDKLGLIVVGYRGSDRSIMSALESIKSERSFSLIWCGKDVSSLHWRVANLIQNTENSFFIQVPDFNTLIIKIWNALGTLQIDIVDIAKKKQSKLNEYLSQVNTVAQKSDSLSGEDKKDFKDYVNINNLFIKAYQEKRPEKQIQQYTAILKFEPDNAYAYNNRGYAYELVNKYEDALKDYQKAVSLDSTNGTFLRNISRICSWTGDQSNAIIWINKAISFEPENSYFLSAKADYLGKLGDYKGAEILLNNCVENFPNEAHIYINRAVLYIETNRFNEAILDLQTAENLGYPRVSELYNNYGVIYRRLKEFELAKDYLRRAIATGENLGFAYGTLALLSADLGNRRDFYLNIDLALKHGCPVWNFFSDPSFKYKDESKLHTLIRKYKPKFRI